MDDVGKNIYLSIVIPVYNSEETIKDVVEGIEKTITGQYPYEVVLINDGSRDSSENICKALAKKLPFIKFINLSKNFGQHNAILAGLRFTEGDYVLFMDDDLQTPPDQIPKLVNKINEGFDVVYANYKVKKHEKGKQIGSKLNDIMARVMLRKPKDLKITSFFIIRKYIVKELINYQGPYPYLGGLVLRTTDKIGMAEVIHKERKIGRSNYGFIRLLRLWLNGFTNFSIKPLRISFFLGLILSLVGFGFSIGLVIRKFIDPEVFLGWTSIIVSILIFSGVQLILLGLAGEYIGRIFLSLNKQPQYVIKEKINV